jgi:hypothetical protein
MIAAMLLTMAATATDQRATEAVQLFSSFCAQANGSRDRAIAVLGEGNALATKLPSDMTDQLLGKTGTVGWAIRSPSGAGLLLGYSGNGHCEIRVQEAEELVIVAEFEKLQQSLATDAADIQAAESKNERDTVRTFRAFKRHSASGKDIIALSTDTKRVGDQQHLITFDLSTD